MDTKLTNRDRPDGRLEDSFFFPDNQKRLPEDRYVEEENRRREKRWHEKIGSCREMEKKLGMKFC